MAFWQQHTEGVGWWCRLYWTVGSLSQWNASITVQHSPFSRGMTRTNCADYSPVVCRDAWTGTSPASPSLSCSQRPSSSLGARRVDPYRVVSCQWKSVAWCGVMLRCAAKEPHLSAVQGQQCVSHIKLRILLVVLEEMKGASPSLATSLLENANSLPTA